MCSFLYSTKNKIENQDKINFYLKFRGPDHTETKIINNDLFLHNLLHITGDLNPQPLIKNNIVLIYNGEIYNYSDFGDYNSDGDCLIPLYENYEDDFVKKLDGEFSICLIDYDKNKIIISSDIFKTKPLFFAYDNNDIGCSTYKSALLELGFSEIHSAKPNTTYIIDYKTKKIIKTKSVYDFDLNQYKSSYFDWIESFKKSIIKRIKNTNQKIFIGLSSGYDSGIIYNELLKNNISFGCLSLLGTENENIIDKRLKLKNEKVEVLNFKKTESEKLISLISIKNKTENFEYTIPLEEKEKPKNLTNDNGAINFATLCRKAKLKNYKICLSGTGADEIISDYGFNGEKKFPHSNFGGIFPKNLKSIFPWKSFYNSTMESYLGKEEYIGGSYGIEMRYPFLDKDVVQEFLWLDYKLKNQEYKAPINFYFNLYNFPFEKGVKRGF
jgi:asparagine synthetase B (glutamine-hydrolysing)